MIGRLSGTLLEKNPPQILLDVAGVAYEVDVPMSTFYNLPDTGGKVTLFTHLVVREDAHLLYGFGTEHERRTFRLLTKISGIGAKIALAVLSGLSVAELAQAITLQESGRLTRVPGSDLSGGADSGGQQDGFASADGLFRVVFVQARGRLSNYRAVSAWLSASTRRLRLVRFAAS